MWIRDPATAYELRSNSLYCFFYKNLHFKFPLNSNPPGASLRTLWSLRLCLPPLLLTPSGGNLHLQLLEGRLRDAPDRSGRDRYSRAPDLSAAFLRLAETVASLRDFSIRGAGPRFLLGAGSLRLCAVDGVSEDDAGPGRVSAGTDAGWRLFDDSRR
jgi:hypothetical protein